MNNVTDIESAIILVREVLCKMGQPLSRAELIRALEPQVIPHLRLVLESMIKSKILVGHMGESQHETAVIRYGLANKADCN